MVAPAAPAPPTRTTAAAEPARPGTGPAPAQAPLSRALRDNAVLAGLLERLAQSDACWAVAAALLPASLAASVRPGPWDAKAWVLLADNAAAAAKLRQALPDIEAALAANGWHTNRIKIKVTPRG